MPGLLGAAVDGRDRRRCPVCGLTCGRITRSGDAKPIPRDYCHVASLDSVQRRTSTGIELANPAAFRTAESRAMELPDKLLDLIYDAAAEQELWRSVLTEIADLTKSQGAAHGAASANRSSSDASRALMTTGANGHAMANAGSSKRTPRASSST